MNKTYLLVAALIAGGILLASAGHAYAYRGNPNVRGPNYTPERHAAMTKAFENKDYNAWKSLMQGRGRVVEVVNEGNFARFAEMHRLMLAGKSEEAAKIRAELGLNLRNGMGNGRFSNR